MALTLHKTLTTINLHKNLTTKTTKPELNFDLKKWQPRILFNFIFRHTTPVKSIYIMDVAKHS